MDRIYEIFKRDYNISDRDWEIFSSKLALYTYPKRHIVLQKGEQENYLSFVDKGILRYYIPSDDNDLTFDFAFKNNFTSAYSSFITRTAAPYQVEAMTEVNLWRLTFDDLQAVYRDTLIGNTIGRHASEQLYMRKARRELSLLNETARQRYDNLFTAQPELLQLVPLKHIASYIGITPQALSRIRARIS